jgi:hypothetical protein
VTRSNIGTRRAAALLVGAGLLLSGCGTGQITETATKVPAVHGANEELSTPNGSYKVRNVAVVFQEDGYAAGDDVPLEMALFNDTGEAVTVQVSSSAAEGVRLVDPSASPSPSPSPSPESPSPTSDESPSDESPSPTASPTETEAPAGPATLQIPANGFVLLNNPDGAHLELVGLRGEVNLGQTVPLTFDFNGQQLEVPAGMGVPLTPLPRPTSVVGEEGEGGH